jgi:LmbE family N-acetylglucosaminyl deacetylase
MGKPPPQWKVVMLSPHCDDIALSLGAFLLAQCGNADVQIITVFSFSACTADDAIEDSAMVTAIRKAEDERFVKSLGQNVGALWWDRKDAPLRLSIPDKAVFHSKPSCTEYDEILHIVRSVKREYLKSDLLLAPMALGCHIDHIVVRNAALDLLAEGFPVAFYEDIPYAADYSLSEIDEYAAHLVSLAGQELDLCAIETGITIEEKIALISCYRSQMDSRTESRVRSHAVECSVNTVVERVWASRKALCAIQNVLRGGGA